MNTGESSARKIFNLPIPRKSYLFLEQDSIPVLNAVESLKDDWTFVQARSLEDLRRRSNREHIWVGLLHLTQRMTVRTYHLLHGLSEVDCRWIALVDAGSLTNPHVVNLIDEVCYDFHLLPADSVRLRTVMGRAHGMARIKLMNNGHSNEGEDHPPASDIVGTSPAMAEVTRCIRKVSRVDASILITGESGTGKELVARAIHDQSHRKKGPFITLNCGAIPHSLIQSELFGFEKGSFTGANQRKIGHIEAAHSGTIILDEIGDMPLELQVNLLRVLQVGKIQRVGSSTEIPVDVRIIAATHIDLEKACKEGRFREDLYYRLNVLKINIPPLRERGEDIIFIARHYFKKFSQEHASKIKGFSPTAIQEMLRHPWPGNVRELINKVKSAVLMSDGPYIQPSDLQLSSRREEPKFSGKTLREIKKNVEREILLSCLQKNQHNISLSSRELGITRTTFYNLLKKYELTPESTFAGE